METRIKYILDTLNLKYKGTEIEKYISSAYILIDKEIEQNGDKTLRQTVYDTFWEIINTYENIVKLEADYERNVVTINSLNDILMEKEELLYHCEGLLVHHQSERAIIQEQQEEKNYPTQEEIEEDLRWEMQEYEEGYTGYGSPSDGHDWFNGVPVPQGWLDD